MTHHTSPATGPEYDLAAAVVASAVAELRGTSRKLRSQAAADILAGGLDYWLDMVVGDGRTFEALAAALRRQSAAA
jgi:hypothetical protein